MYTEAPHFWALFLFMLMEMTLLSIMYIFFITFAIKWAKRQSQQKQPSSGLPVRIRRFGWFYVLKGDESRNKANMFIIFRRVLVVNHKKPHGLALPELGLTKKKYFSIKTRSAYLIALLHTQILFFFQEEACGNKDNSYLIIENRSHFLFLSLILPPPPPPPPTHTWHFHPSQNLPKLSNLISPPHNFFFKNEGVNLANNFEGLAKLPVISLVMTCTRFCNHGGCSESL